VNKFLPRLAGQELPGLSALAVPPWFSREESQLNLWIFEREQLRHIAGGLEFFEIKKP